MTDFVSQLIKDHHSGILYPLTILQEHKRDIERSIDLYEVFRCYPPALWLSIKEFIDMLYVRYSIDKDRVHIDEYLKYLKNYRQIDEDGDDTANNRILSGRSCPIQFRSQYVLLLTRKYIFCNGPKLMSYIRNNSNYFTDEAIYHILSNINFDFSKEKLAEPFMNSDLYKLVTNKFPQFVTQINTLCEHYIKWDTEMSEYKVGYFCTFRENMVSSQNT